MKRFSIGLSAAVLLLNACNGGSYVRDPSVTDVSVLDANDMGTDAVVFDQDIQAITVPDVPSPQPDWDVIVRDPPPRFCGPGGEDGGTAPDVVRPMIPGGTVECPDDKNNPGCPCPLELIGQERPCWTGARINRNHGTCRDGVARCERYSELTGRWGACSGVVLPTPGVTRGPEACQCFSRGQWLINNASVCVFNFPNGPYAVSTFVNDEGRPSCPTNPGNTPPPSPEPGRVWSRNRLTVDCEGEYELCITIRAGNIRSPQPSDCVLTRRCTRGWYGQRGVPQEFPPLDNWSSPDTACAARFLNENGYGEYTVFGRSAECEAVDNGAGQPHVFTRIGFCAPRCSENPRLPGCENCTLNVAGMF